MARRRRFTFDLLNFVSLFPLWTALLGLIVCGYGWANGDLERIHQGLALMTTFLLCFAFIGIVSAFSLVLRFAIWCYQKICS